MAERRMFSSKIVCDDRFTDLPSSAQALYMHLCMLCDDDGFTNKIKIALMQAQASTQDMELLISSRYVIRFPSGVICIKHWYMSNRIRKDRYTPTSFKDERDQLFVHEPGVYSFEKGDDEMFNKPQNKPLKITFE